MNERDRTKASALAVGAGIFVLVGVGLIAALACGTSSQAPSGETEPPATTTVTPASTDPESASNGGNDAHGDDAEGNEAPAVVAAPPEPTHPRNCPPESEWPEGMACVLGGTFMLGNAEGRPDEREPGEVYVDTFYMDKTEVTNAAFEECIQAGACTRPMPFRRFMGPRQPVVAVSWYDAVHHCERIGKRLPTDAEWERAAGGVEHTEWSWGNEPPTCERANLKTEAGEGCGGLITRDVGSFPPGHFGLYDMTGNVHEWVQDMYSECLRGCAHECGDACFGDNPRGPCGGEDVRCPGFGLRSVRGGSWYWPPERARVTARRGSGAPNRGPHRFGFRCARDLEAPAPGAMQPSESAGEARGGLTRAAAAEGE